MTYDPEYRLRHAVAEAIVEPSDYVTRSALRSAEAIIRLLRADEQLLAILCHGHPAAASSVAWRRRERFTTGDQ